MHVNQRPALRLVGVDERLEAPAAERIDVARWALVAVAVLQIGLGVAQIAGIHAVDLVNGGHVGNESAAWNIAWGAAFLGVARAGRCHTGVLTMLSAFLAVLSLLTVSDLLGGRVGLGRLGTHAVLVTGFLLVLHLTRRTGQATPISAERLGTFPVRATTTSMSTPPRNGHHANHPHARFPSAYSRRDGAGRRPEHAGSRRLR
ncbi:hypothetical protein ACWKSP_37285 [Micromonosporaceae bacterium Da 78-11]